MSREQTQKAIDLLAEEGQFDMLIQALQIYGSADTSFMIVEKLRSVGEVTVLPGLLEVWEKPSTLSAGSESATIEQLYRGKLILLIWELTGEEIPLDKEARYMGPEAYSKEAAAIIAHAKVWWSEHAYLYGMEPLATNDEEASTPTPSPIVNAEPKTEPRELPPTPAVAKQAPALKNLWLIALLAIGAITAAVITRRRKRPAA